MNITVTNLQKVPAQALALRQQVREYVTLLRKALAEAETRWMQLADAVYESNSRGIGACIVMRRAPDTRASRIDAECTLKHSTIFSVLRVRRTLEGKLIGAP
jgi:hypothetical protein